MKWVSTISRTSDVRDNIAAQAETLSRALPAGHADLLVVFVSRHFAEVYDELPGLLSTSIRYRHLLGCSAGGVVGGGEEVEHGPAISLTAAHLPGVNLKLLHSDTLNLPDDDASPEAWKAWMGLPGTESADFVILADPLTTASEGFLAGMDYAFPRGAKVGGLASGGDRAQGNVLFLDDQVYREGLVAVAMDGDIEVDTVVAQGCRPIGAPLTITDCEHNLLLSLDHQPPVKKLKQLMETLDEHDRKLVRTSLFLGIEMNAFESDPLPGHFLIRNLVGVDYHTGAIAAGALFNEGQVVQFHLRDRETSAADLRHHLEQARERCESPLSGALLFSCLGRGRYLYGLPDHDSNLFTELLGPVPMGGLFCNGEIGPVGASTYLHGYTSSFALFRPPS